MKTALKNIAAFIVFAACITYLYIALTILPATRSGVLAITTGQAFAVAVGYLLIMINQHGSTVKRLTARLRRLTRRQVKLFIAQLTLWLVAGLALLFSVISVIMKPLND